MRINNVEYPNVSIRVIESKRVVGLTGPKVVHRYEASVKRGAATQKRASENIAELQDWILLKVGGRMRSAEQLLPGAVQPAGGGPGDLRPRPRRGDSPALHRRAGVHGPDLLPLLHGGAVPGKRLHAVRHPGPGEFRSHLPAVQPPRGGGGHSSRRVSSSSCKAPAS